MRPEDEDEFRRFTAARWPGLVRTTYLLTGDLGHAEDLAQTTLIKAYRSWNRVRRVDDIDAYVRKILINANRSRFRSKRLVEYSVARVPEHHAAPDASGAVEERDVLFAALAGLPPKQRAIVVLRYWEDLAEGEVADGYRGYGPCRTAADRRDTAQGPFVAPPAERTGRIGDARGRRRGGDRGDDPGIGIGRWARTVRRGGHLAPAAAGRRRRGHDGARVGQDQGGALRGLPLPGVRGPQLGARQSTPTGRRQRNDPDPVPPDEPDRPERRRHRLRGGGNAVVCAGDQGHFYAYRDAVYAHQPAEATDFFQSPARLIQIAREIPGLDTPAFEKCVDDQPYAAAISRNYDTAANTAHCQGMPCVNADGRQWTNSVLQGQSLGAAADKWLNQIIMSHQRTS